MHILKANTNTRKKCFFYKRHLGVVVIKLTSPGQVKQVVALHKTARVFFLPGVVGINSSHFSGKLIIARNANYWPAWWSD